MAKDHPPPSGGSAARTTGDPQGSAQPRGGAAVARLADRFDAEASRILCEAQGSDDPVGALTDTLLRRSHHHAPGLLSRFMRHVFSEVDVDPPARRLRLDFAPVLVQRAVAGTLASCWGEINPDVQRQAEAAITRHVRDAAMLRLLAQSTLPPSLQAHCRGLVPSVHAKRGAALFVGMKKDLDLVQGAWEAEEARRVAFELEEERRGLERARKAAAELRDEGGNVSPRKRQRMGGGQDLQVRLHCQTGEQEKDAPAQRAPGAGELPAVDTAAMAKLKAGLAGVRPHGGAESLPKDIASLLDVPRLEEALGLVEMHELCDEVLLLVVGVLFKGATSQRQAQGFMRCVLLPKVFGLGQPASRALLSAILKTCKEHPRAAIHHLILPLLATEKVGSASVEVVNRIAKESLLEAQRVQLLAAILDAHCDERGGVLTLASIAVLQGLLSLKIPIGPEALHKFVQVLDASCVQLSKQLKFSSLTLSLLTHHGRLLAPHAGKMLQVAATLETGLKKPVQKLAQKLSTA